MKHTAIKLKTFQENKLNFSINGITLMSDINTDRKCNISFKNTCGASACHCSEGGC